MKEVVKIEVEGVEVNLHFRFSTLYKLGKKWDLNSVNQVIEKVVRVCALSGGEITIEALEVLSDVIIICSDKAIEKEAVIDYLGNNPELIVKVVGLMAESMSGPKQVSEKEEVEEVGK